MAATVKKLASNGAGLRRSLLVMTRWNICLLQLCEIPWFVFCVIELCLLPSAHSETFISDIDSQKRDHLLTREGRLPLFVLYDGCHLISLDRWKHPGQRDKGKRVTLFFFFFFVVEHLGIVWCMKESKAPELVLFPKAKYLLFNTGKFLWQRRKIQREV